MARRREYRLLGMDRPIPRRESLNGVAMAIGYAYTPDGPVEEPPHVVGRRPLGRVAPASSDSEAAAFTNTAIDANDP